jgi:hypothetical protein
VLTKREKKLMLAAAENTFWVMVNKLDIKTPNINYEKEMKDWLENPIADNGGTTEEYLDWMHKEK